MTITLPSSAYEGALLTAILKEVRVSDANECAAYLCGAMHDGTRSDAHRTIRISQSHAGWMEVLQAALSRIGSRSWTYRESGRQMYVVEAVDRLPDPAPLQSSEEKIAYVRGYFDAEGGFPRSTRARAYIQFAQKDLEDIQHLKGILRDLRIRAGRLHNPSRRADPDYWRFYVPTSDHKCFFRTIRPWHPRKRASMELRWTERDGRTGRVRHHE